MTAVEAPPLLAWLEAQIASDEQRANAADSGERWAAQRSGGVDTHDDGDPYLTNGDLVWSVAGPYIECHDSPQGKAEALHIATWDPARALLECAAKRRILGRHAPTGATILSATGTHPSCSCCGLAWPCHDVLDVAGVYQDRDGWQEGWAPRG